MLRRFRPYALGPTSLILVGLLLASCGGATTPAAQDAAATEAVAAVPSSTTANPTEVSQGASTSQADTPAPAAKEVEPTTQTEVAPTTAVEVAGPPQPAACQSVQIPTNQGVAPISKVDWAKGPATAPVTVIEYGDFQ